MSTVQEHSRYASVPTLDEFQSSSVFESFVALHSQPHLPRPESLGLTVDIPEDLQRVFDVIYKPLFSGDVSTFLEDNRAANVVCMGLLMLGHRGELFPLNILPRVLHEQMLAVMRHSNLASEELQSSVMRFMSFQPLVAEFSLDECRDFIEGESGIFFACSFFEAWWSFYAMLHLMHRHAKAPAKACKEICGPVALRFVGAVEQAFLLLDAELDRLDELKPQAEAPSSKILLTPEASEEFTRQLGDPPAPNDYLREALRRSRETSQG